MTGTFFRDEQYARAVERFYGEYVISFRSRNNQVRADIFRQEGQLVAHVSFAPGMTYTSVTDPYWSDLKRYADEQHAELSVRIAA